MSGELAKILDATFEGHMLGRMDRARQDNYDLSNRVGVLNNELEYAYEQVGNNGFLYLLWQTAYDGANEATDDVFVPALKELGVSDEDIKSLKDKHFARKWEHTMNMLCKDIEDNPKITYTVYKSKNSVFTEEEYARLSSYPNMHVKEGAPEDMLPPDHPDRISWEREMEQRLAP